MKVLLIDVDGKIPNLALARLAAYHKRRRDTVELLKLNYGGYPGTKRTTVVDSRPYDKVYAAILYRWNHDVLTFTNRQNVMIGGTGYNVSVTLPASVDREAEDFSLYGDPETVYGFVTRGCIRKCPFCLVPEKEGMIRKVNDVADLLRPNTKKLILMDNNILAYPDHAAVLDELLALGVRCHFNSGLDIRLATPANLDQLSRLNYDGEYLFSFDIPRQKDVITRQAELTRRFITKPWKLKMCLLVGFNSTLAEDIGRVLWCLERQILPYVMRHENCWSSPYRDFYTDLAAWANQAAFVKKMTFAQFLPARHATLRDRNRIPASMAVWNQNIMDAKAWAR